MGISGLLLKKISHRVDTPNAVTYLNWTPMWFCVAPRMDTK